MQQILEGRIDQGMNLITFSIYHCLSWQQTVSCAINKQELENHHQIQHA